MLTVLNDPYTEKAGCEKCSLYIAAHIDCYNHSNKMILHKSVMPKKLLVTREGIILFMHFPLHKNGSLCEITPSPSKKD
jgi:hypothetical protein